MIDDDDDDDDDNDEYLRKIHLHIFANFKVRQLTQL